MEIVIKEIESNIFMVWFPPWHSNLEKIWDIWHKIRTLI